MRHIGSLLFAALLAHPVLAHHEFFRTYIQEDWRLSIGDEIDIEAILHFNVAPAAHQRKQMDQDDDGTISDSELAAYRGRLTSHFGRSIRLEVDGRARSVYPLYPIEIDLLGDRSRSHRPFLVRVSSFSAGGVTLQKGSSITLRCGSWHGFPSLRRFTPLVLDEGKLEEVAQTPGSSEVVGQVRIASSHVIAKESPATEEPHKTERKPVSSLVPRHGPQPSQSATSLAPLSLFATLSLFVVAFRRYAFGMRSSILIALVATAGAADSMAATQTTGAAEFVANVLQQHRYLLGEEQQHNFERLLRDLRQAEGQSEAASLTDEQRAAHERLATSQVALVAALESVADTIDLVYRDGQQTEVPKPSKNVPGDIGALIFRVDCGPGDVQFATVDWDMTRSAAPHVDVDASDRGTTWVVVGMRNVPADTTSMTVFVNISGKARIGVPIEINAPPPGRLRMTILSAETGEPIPVMLRLRWKTDDTVRGPSNALDFTSQLDYHSGMGVVHGVRPDGRRQSQVRGWGGFFWCCPGPFDMTLPPGEWEVAIRHGYEFIPITDTFTIESKRTVEKQYRVRRWIDMPARGWFSGDDHVHFQIMNDEDARRLMAYVQAEDVHVTNILQMGDITRTWFHQRGFGPAYRVVDGDYALVPGQEGPRTHGTWGLGHYVGLDTRRYVRDPKRYFLYDWVYDEIHADGGLSGYPHLAYEDEGGIEILAMSIHVPAGKADFAALMQDGRLGTRHYFDFLNLGFKIPATAGSDVPWSRTIGEVRFYVYCGEGSLDVDRWFKALAQGRTFVTNGPMLDLRVNNAMPGDQVGVSGSQKVRVTASAFGHPGRKMTPSKLEILVHGDVVHKALPTHEGQEELALDVEIDAGYGCWIVARAAGTDRSVALTSPVYVVRDGYHWWKVDAIDEIVQRRLANLQEVEDMVKSAIRKAADGEVGSYEIELWQFIAQAPLLLQRVDAARQRYFDLATQARGEMARRK